MRRLAALLLLLALLAAALGGCGAILVEDREPVLVGMCEYSHKVPENAAVSGTKSCIMMSNGWKTLAPRVRANALSQSDICFGVS